MRLDRAGRHPLGDHGAGRRGRPGTWGRRRPRDTAPTWWPARPTRCSPDATLGGASTCTTRSTAPMSMPSSRLDVATTHGSSAGLELLLDERALLARHRAVVRLRHDRRRRLRRSRTARSPRPGRLDARSAVARDGVESRPRSGSSAASSLSRAVSRSASRRELANTIVERCCRTRSSSRRSTAGQIDGRCAVPAAEPMTSSSDAARRRPLVERREVRHRHLDGDLDRLRRGRLHHLDRPGPGQERRHLVQRPDGRRQPDPLGGPAVSSSVVEPLQRQRQVGAALGARHRVHLVEDHRARPRAATPAPPR